MEPMELSLITTMLCTHVIHGQTMDVLSHGDSLCAALTGWLLGPS